MEFNGGKAMHVRPRGTCACSEKKYQTKESILIEHIYKDIWQCRFCGSYWKEKESYPWELTRYKDSGIEDIPEEERTNKIRGLISRDGSRPSKWGMLAEEYPEFATFLKKYLIYQKLLDGAVYCSWVLITFKDKGAEVYLDIMEPEIGDEFFLDVQRFLIFLVKYSLTFWGALEIGKKQRLEIMYTPLSQLLEEGVFFDGVPLNEEAKREIESTIELLQYPNGKPDDCDCKDKVEVAKTPLPEIYIYQCKDCKRYWLKQGQWIPDPMMPIFTGRYLWKIASDEDLKFLGFKK